MAGFEVSVPCIILQWEYKDQLDATVFEFIVEEVIALHVSGVYAHRQEQQQLHRKHMVF
jgi:hypothetical protein